jgi:hypothetical protein
MTLFNACRFVALVFVIGVRAIAPSPVFAQAFGNWTSTGALNTPRSGHTATLLLDGQVLVAGGQSSNGTIVATAELYNPNTGEWTLTGSMATARTDHTATLLPNGEVLVAGGIGVGDPQSPCTSTAELYNPLTGQRRNTGSMTAARFWHGATSLQNGKSWLPAGTSAGVSPVAHPREIAPNSTTRLPALGRRLVACTTTAPQH